MAEARLVVNQKALDLAIAGPRKEEVAEAEAQLRAVEAQLGLRRQELADAQRVAPVDAVVRTRIMEPGEMASPQKPVFSLAITDPKWVWVYIPKNSWERWGLRQKRLSKKSGFLWQPSCTRCVPTVGVVYSVMVTMLLDPQKEGDDEERFQSHGQ